MRSASHGVPKGSGSGTTESGARVIGGRITVALKPGARQLVAELIGDAGVLATRSIEIIAA